MIYQPTALKLDSFLYFINEIRSQSFNLLESVPFIFRSILVIVDYCISIVKNNNVYI